MREAPSLDLLPLLIEKGHTVKAYDPFATENARKLLPESVSFVTSPMEATKDAQALVLLTEWDVFRGANLSELKQTMKGTDLFDGRNVYQPELVREAGLTYHGIGVQ
jgi:UDPglucose 6-dehydrogenase